MRPTRTALLLGVAISLSCAERALPLDEHRVVGRVDAAVAPDFAITVEHKDPDCNPNCALDCDGLDELGCAVVPGCVADFCQEQEGDPVFIGCRDPNVPQHACPSAK
jgi:hypothetical protein